MASQGRTQGQLSSELDEMRQRIAELEASDAERERVEEELREWQETSRGMLESAATGIWLTQDGKFQYVSPLFEDITGYTNDDLIGTSSLQYIHPDDREATRESALKSLKGESDLPHEFRFIRKDGTPIFILERMASIQYRGKRAAIGSFMDITERQRAEDRIEHLNDVLRAIRNVNQLIVKEKDRDRLLQSACDTLIETRGYHHVWMVLIDEFGEFVTSAEAGIGEGFQEVLERLKNGGMIECGRRALAQPEVVVINDPSSTCGDCPQAGAHPGRGSMCGRLEYGGKIYGLLSISMPAEVTTDDEERYLLQEVTGDIGLALHTIELEEDHKLAEEAMREGEEFSSGLLSNAPNPIVVIEPDTSIKYVNPAMEELTGFSEAEIIGAMPPYPWWTEATIEKMKVDFMKVMAKGMERAEQQFQKKSGELFWVEVTARPVRKNGELDYYLITWMDITERKQVEEKLRESREVSRGMLESAATGTWLIQDGKFKYASPLFTHISGYTSDELIGTESAQYLHPDDRERAREKAIENLTGKSDLPYEFRFIRKDGAPIWILERVASIQYRGERAAIGSFLDISAFKRSEEMLRESEEKLRIMFESIGDGITVTDLKGNIIDVNQAALDIHGFSSKEEVIGRNGFDLIAEKDRARAIEDNKRTMQAGQSGTMEYALLTRDGREFEGEVIAALLKDEAGNPTGMVNVVRNVTQRKIIEQTKSDFVSLVSHQLKTPVAQIKAYIENIQDGITGEVTSKQKEYLGEMHEICVNNYRLISDLLNVSMIERGVLSLNIEPIKLRTLVDLAVRDYHNAIREKGLALNFEGSGDRLVVLADRDKFVECLRNVINNAVKFTDKGAITISIESEDQFGVVKVRDTGRGMAEDILTNLFKKEKVLSGGARAGGGAILGLYIAKGFMKLQHGDITATSAEDKGSTFTLTIPKK